MSEGYKKAEREISTDREEQIKEKKKKKREEEGGEGGEKGEEADALLLRTWHISGARRGSGSRRDRRGRDGRSSHDSKTFSNISWPLLRHFSSDSGSERAGWWRGQPLSDVDSQPQSEDV